MPINEKKLAEWADAAIQLAKFKAKEMKLRLECFEEGFPKPIIGVNYLTLGNDYRLRATYKLGYKVDPQALDATLEQLPVAVADKLIKYNPALVLAAYKGLATDDKAIMDEALTIKPGAPTLEIVAPSKEADDA